MKHHITSLALALAAAITLGLSPAANAGTPAGKSNSEGNPNHAKPHPRGPKTSLYKDKVVGKIFEATPTEAGVRLAFTARGTATQLGLIRTLGFLDVNLADLSFTGENTITAANGSQIFLTITGQLTPTDDPAVFVIELDTEFQSGTGWLEGVSGGFHGAGLLTATPDFVGSVFEGTGRGLIITPRKRQ